MKQRVYIDTSVIGGCFDHEFEEWSNKLFDEFNNGWKIAVLSDITLDELTNAPKRVRQIIETMPEHTFEIFASDNESEELANKYLLDKAVTEKYYEDALHIAIATIQQVHVLASWNFKHIVNLEKIKLYNAVNLKNSYPMIEIRTPREIIHFIENED